MWLKDAWNVTTCSHGMSYWSEEAVVEKGGREGGAFESLGDKNTEAIQDRFRLIP